MPVVKPIAGHTSVRGVANYLQKDDRALAVDLYNLSWDEDRDADLDQELKRDVDWAAEMDLTRIANGNDTPWRGKRARTYMHFVVSPDPEDKVTLQQLRELTRAWIRENWDDYECAAVFHDDNANEVMHAHVVVNNTNLATGNRFQNPNPRVMQASIQRLAQERGLSFFVDVSHEEDKGTSLPGREAPRTRQVVYYRRAEREIAEKGGYSWVADIRSRVTVAKRTARTPDEYRQMLAAMGVTVTDAAKRNGRADWVYALADADTRRIRGESLGLAFGRKAVEGAMRGNAPLDRKQIASIAAKAIEVRDYAQLERMASALEIGSKHGIRCMADFDSRIAAMKRRGNDRAVSELRFAKTTARELNLLPNEIKAKPRTARNQDIRQRQRTGESARAGEQAARQRQIQQEQQRNDRRRRER